MRIERLKKEHIPALLQIERACFGKSAWSYDGFSAELESESALFLTALEREEVLGCIALNDACGQGFISKLMVTPAHRRQGIAAALLTALEQQAAAQKIYELTLEVRESNLPAIALYEGFGFRNLGKRRQFYHDPAEDALIMTKRL